MRTQRTISEKSGTVLWRIKVSGIGPFFLGVTGSGFHSGHCPRSHPQVWLTCGGSFNWNLMGFGGKTNFGNVLNEPTDAFEPGDVIAMYFNPFTRSLTAAIEGKPGWLTSRRLEGEGLNEVTPFVYLCGKESKATLLSYGTMAMSDFEVRRLNSTQSQMPFRLSRQQTVLEGRKFHLFDLEADIRYSLREDEKDERIQLESQCRKIKEELKSRVLETRVDLLMGILGDFRLEMHELRRSSRHENQTLRNEVSELRQKLARLTHKNEFTTAMNAGYEVVDFEE